MIETLKRMFSGKVDLVSPTPSAQRKPIKISDKALAHANTKRGDLLKRFQPPQMMPGVVPAQNKPGHETVIAMDDAFGGVYDYANLGGYNTVSFPGYPYLAQLTQLVEYRKLSEIPAKEMTRKWIKMVSKGDGDKSEKIARIEAVAKELNIRSLFRDAAMYDGFYGRAQIYIDVKAPNGMPALDNPEELKTPLLLNDKKIAKGSLRGLTLIEPMWTYPYLFNSVEPLKRDFYTPEAWFVMGKQVHRTRLLNFISRPVPDILKPAYNFGGMSMSQLAQPYVNNWIRTRDSVSDMIHSFSTSGVKMNLQALLQGDGGILENQVLARIELFARMRDNRGVMPIDKETEDFFQNNVPLGGLNELQVEAMNMLCYVSNIPPVKMFGTAAAGLNASDEGTIKVFYDFIAAEQEDGFRNPLKIIFDVIQLSEFGEIDPDISFEFEPLWQPNGTELAAIRKSDSDGAVAMVGAGILAPEEVRASLAADPDSGYESINVSDVPDPPEPPDTNNLDQPDDNESAPSDQEDNA